MDSKIIVFGVSPFSRMVCALLEAGGKTVAARTAHVRFIPVAAGDGQTDGPPFVAFETLAQTHAPHEHQVIVALEHARANVARAEIAEAAKAMGYNLASYIHPSAQLGEGVTLGEHCLVLEGVIAQYGAHIGANAILGAKCFLGQQVRVQSNVYFGSGVFVDRFAQIGHHCTFGSQVRIAESVNVPNWTQVKAFEDLRESLKQPTLVLDGLRAPGFIVDRR